MLSPTIGHPIAAQWTRSWCVRPVTGVSASQVRFFSPPPLAGEGREGGDRIWPQPSPRPACGERSARSCAPGEGDSPRVWACGESPSPRPSPRKRGEGEETPNAYAIAWPEHREGGEAPSRRRGGI